MQARKLNATSESTTSVASRTRLIGHIRTLTGEDTRQSGRPAAGGTGYATALVGTAAACAHAQINATTLTLCGVTPSGATSALWRQPSVVVVVRRATRHPKS